MGRVAEVKVNCGFLRRLEEEGLKVFMDKDTNEILYMEEKERARKEKMIQDYKNKEKKPRPRDILKKKRNSNSVQI